jgi:glutathione S-transferase
MKLYTTFPGHFVSYCPQITAQLCGIHLTDIHVPPESDLAKSEELKAKKAHWNWPMLETPDGKIITQSVAIAQFIAREAGRADLTGHNAFEEA